MSPKQGVSVAAPTVLIAATGIHAATLAGGTVYWVEQDGSGGAPLTNSVKSAPLMAAGAVTDLGTFPGLLPPTSIAVAGTTIVIGGGPVGAEIFDTDGGVSQLGNAYESCMSLLAAPDGVYCAGTPIVLVPVNGATTTISSQTNQPQSMALDGTNLYWVNPVSSGSVATAPKLGGATGIVAYDDIPIALAVDDAAVYWSDTADNLQGAAKQW